MAVHLHRIAPLHPYSPESGDAGRTRLALIEKTLRDNWLVGKSIDFLHEQLTGSTGIVLSRRQLLRYFAKLGWRRRGAAATPEQRACIARAVHGMHVARGMGAAAAILSQFSLFLTTFPLTHRPPSARTFFSFCGSPWLLAGGPEGPLF